MLGPLQEEQALRGRKTRVHQGGREKIGPGHCLRGDKAQFRRVTGLGSAE